MRNFWNGRLLLVLAGIAVLALGIGCGRADKSATSAASSPLPVQVGVLRLASSAPLFIGLEKGFFAEEGLAVEPVWFDAAQPVAVATAADEVQVGASGLTAGLYNLAAGGKVPVLVADKGRETAAHSGSVLVVTRAQYDSGVRTVADLVGKRIGNTQAGSSYQYMLGAILEQAGLSVNAVSYANLGKVGAIVAALRSGQIDGAILNEPHASRLLADGTVCAIAPIGELLPCQVSAIFYAPSFAADSERGTAFMRGYIRACRYYYDVVFARTPEERDADPRYRELIDIIARYTSTPPEEIGRMLPYIDRDGALDEASIAAQIDWYRAHGYIREALSPADILRTDIRLRAAEELGVMP